MFVILQASQSAVPDTTYLLDFQFHFSGLGSPSSNTALYAGTISVYSRVRDFLLLTGNHNFFTKILTICSRKNYASCTLDECVAFCLKSVGWGGCRKEEKAETVEVSFSLQSNSHSDDTRRLKYSKEL